MKHFITCALLGLSGFIASAQTLQPAEKSTLIKDEAFNNSSVDSLSQFFTDQLGPRLAASKSKLRAESLVVEQLKKIGIKDPKVVFAHKFDKGGWDNHRTYVAMTSPYYCSFAGNPVAWTGSTNGEVKGECIVLDAETPADLKKFSGKLKGKVVLMPVTQTYEISFRPLARRYSEEDLDNMTKDNRPRKRWGRPRGVTSNLNQMIDSMIQAEKPLAIVKGSGTFNVTGSRGAKYKAGSPERVPEIMLPIEDHGRMVRLIKGGTPVEMELDIKNEFSDNQQINNVIAEIPGTDPKLKDEVVLIGAHLDSWHGGTGAADNAAGCVVMTEALRILNQLDLKPRRTIRLALWGGEEQGLYGSRGYANLNLFDPEKKKVLDGYDDFTIYMNMDFGSGRFKGVYFENNDRAAEFFKTWSQPLESLGFSTFSPSKVGSTDHVSFSSLGLPAYQFIQDPLEYGRTYHTPMDTYERLATDDLKINAAIVAWLAYSAAMDPERIPLMPGYPEKLNKSEKK